MKIALLDSFPAELDLVARDSPHATFYHTTLWLNAVAAAYPRLTPQCLTARTADGLVGYLPFFISRRGPLRRAWSLPFGTYGGPACADDAATMPLLESFAAQIRRPGILEVGWVDFRNLTRADDPGRWYETHLVDLLPGFDLVYREKFATQRRQRVRRAEKLGVTVRRERDPAALAAYCRIFRARIAAFGSEPMYTDRLYEALFARGGDAVRLHLAYRDDEAVGGHLNFHYKDTVIAWYGVVAPGADKSQAGSLLYASCMRDACDEGYSTYNLGASLNKPSLIDFKESLGGVAHRYPVHLTRSLLGRLVGSAR